jgi:hypothetical protein
MEVKKKIDPKQATKAEVEKLFTKVMKAPSYAGHFKELTKSFLNRKNLDILNDPNFKKLFINEMKNNREIKRQMNEARKSGIKLPTWAYPEYVVKAYPDVFLKSKKSLASVPKKIR